MSSEEKSELLQTKFLASSCCLVPGLNIVPCSLKELPLHCPSCATDTAASNRVSSSSQRRKSSRAPGLPPADVFAQLTVEQIVLSRKPTIIDRLISQNKTALIMESRARKRAIGVSSKDDSQIGCKRKATFSEQHLERKRLRSSKNDGKKICQKSVLPPKSRRKKMDSDPAPPTNRYSTRISMNKVKIPFSLRSGRKMADILKSKCKRALKQHRQQNDVEKKVKQLDSNSNTYSRIDQHDVKGKVEEENKRKRKRRKRCSMWVRKVKKPTRKVEDLPVLNKVESEEEQDEDELEEELEPLMPTLEKQVDNCDIKLNQNNIKLESPDVSIQEKNSIQEELGVDKTNELSVNVPINIENEQTTAIENINIKIEETSNYSHDTQSYVNNDDKQKKSDQDVPSALLNEKLTTQENIGTKDSVLDCKSNDYSLCNESGTTINSLDRNIEEIQPEENQKANKNNNSGYENVETDLKSIIETEGDIYVMKEEDHLDTKDIKMSVNSTVIETDLNEKDVINNQKMNTTTVEYNDKIVNEIISDKLENYEINVQNESLIEDNIKRQNSVESKIAYEHTNLEMKEELNPSEADSTSDVKLTIDNNTENEQYICASEEDSTNNCLSETSVLPDSTKEVIKSASPELVVDKEGLPLNEIVVEKSEGVKLQSYTNDIKPIEIHKEDLSENENKVKPMKKVDGKLSVEQKQMKESVLKALGLKSLSTSTTGSELKQIDEDKQQKRFQQQQKNNSGYTGTLKAVIKLSRTGDKKRTMVYKRNEDDLATSDKLEYRICSDLPSADEVPITHLADMGYNKKGFHHKNTESVTNSVYVNANNNTPHVEEPEGNNDESKGNKESSLIIPEKSSSFSIHPGRLCSDVCSYCFGKFGSLDTPCHVAQLKGEERQKKILQNEPHLTPESCLCDACYRYVDRKVNYHPKSANQQSSNTNTHKSTHEKPQPQTTCCVVRCSQLATHTIKRKWILKLKKSLANKLDIDMDKHTGIYFPFCTQHHCWVEYLTVCAICRKRLNRNNLFSLAREADRLNLMLAEDGIPARLSDNLFLCKLCRYYSNLRLKYSDTSAIPTQNKSFYKSYRRKILMSLDMAVSNSEDDCDNSEDASSPEKKRSNNNSNSNGTNVLSRKPCPNTGNGNGTADNLPSGSTPSTKENTPEEMVSLSELATIFGDQPEPQQTRIQVKFGNVNIGTLSNLNIGQQSGGPAAVSGNNDKEGDGALSCHLNFKGSSTADDRCVCTIQFDKKAKQMWTELQKPFGSQSLFLRHLITMEKIWRSGHLVLSSSADDKTVKYVLNAKNKIRPYDSNINGNNTEHPSQINSTQVRQQANVNEVKQSSNSSNNNNNNNNNNQPIRIRQQLQQQAKLPLYTQQQKAQQLPQPQQNQQPQQALKKVIPQPKQERFPLIPNTGEIEVTAVRTSSQASIPVHQTTPVTVISSYQQQQYLRPSTGQQQHRATVQQTTSSSSQQYNVLQQQLMSKKLTPLDRAKSLVRMAIPQPRPPPPRYYVPPQNSVTHQQYYSGIGGSGTSSGSANRAPPPPLMKLQAYLQHQQQINQQSAALQQNPYHLQHYQQQHQIQQQQRTILPKLPKSLTVVSRTNSKPTAITLQHSGITIEKQSSVPPLRSSHPLPIEKPIISVFREPAISPQHH